MDFSGIWQDYSIEDTSRGFAVGLAERLISQRLNKELNAKLSNKWWRYDFEDFRQAVQDDYQQTEKLLVAPESGNVTDHGEDRHDGGS